MNDKNVNSSDASIGQPMVERVLARKHELEALLASSPADNGRTQNDIATALNTVNSLLSGDLAHVPAVVLVDMNRWLENNKHLAESATPNANAANAAANASTANDDDAPPVTNANEPSNSNSTTSPIGTLGSAWSSGN
jgi:hypothetical protein